MNPRMWGIIGGVVLVLALLSPLVLGSSKKVEQLFEAAETLCERSNYKGAIPKYKEALKESKKFGAKTERIDKDFTTLVNLKIAHCYYELAENNSDIRHYQNSLTHIREVVLDAKVAKHREELTYLWAENLYKVGNLDEAESKFSWLVKNFSNSQWVPKALYTVGEINLKQENRDEALKVFQKLVDEFQHSELRVKAEQRILEIEDLLRPDPPEPDLEAKTIYNSAFNLQQQGKNIEAYQLYTDLIKQHPDSKYTPEANIQIAEIYLEEKDYVKARLHYEAAMDKMDDEQRKTEIYEAYHRTYLVPVYASDSPKLEEINPEHFVRERISEETNQLRPNDPSRLDVINQWNSIKGEILVNATRLRADERFMEAAREYEAFENTDPPHEDAVYALYWAGRCYHFAASTDETLFTKSVGAFQRLIMNYGDSPNTIEAYYGLVLVYSEWAQKPSNESKWDSVLNTFKEVKTKFANDKSDLVQQTLRKMAPFKDRAEKSINDYRENTRKEHYVDQGYLYFGRDELEKGEKNARDAIRIDNTYRRAHQLLEAITEAYYSRGIAALNQNQYEKAITQFEKSVRISPRFKKAFCNLGVAYIEQNEYVKAINPLKEAIAIDSKFKEAHFNLGLAYLRLGNYDYARNSAYAALEIDSQYEPAYKLLDSMTD